MKESERKRQTETERRMKERDRQTEIQRDIWSAWDKRVG
jgi:hypothetical protein